MHRRNQRHPGEVVPVKVSAIVAPPKILNPHYQSRQILSRKQVRPKSRGCCGNGKQMPIQQVSPRYRRPATAGRIQRVARPPLRLNAKDGPIRGPLSDPTQEGGAMTRHGRWCVFLALILVAGAGDLESREIGNGSPEATARDSFGESRTARECVLEDVPIRDAGAAGSLSMT